MRRRLSMLLAAGLSVVPLLPGPVATAVDVPPAPGVPPWPDAANLDACTGTSPVTCHYDLPPGHYDVTVLLGDSLQPAATEVRAEARRLMIAETATEPGQFVRRTFTVNVRDPEGEPTKSGVGSPGLTLTFAGAAPKVTGIGIAESRRHRTIYLAGDSTVCDQDTFPYTGWGQRIPTHLEQGVSIANYADSGESSGSFLADPRLFDTMRPLIRPNDLVLIQFGHNDKQTTAEDFRANLARLVSGVREQGGKPVLVTPVVRRIFDSNGKLAPVALHWNGLGVNLPAEMRQVAREQRIPLIDLTEDSRILVEELGPEASKDLYLFREKRDNTHFSEYGATEIAELVTARLRDPRIVPPAFWSER